MFLGLIISFVYIFRLQSKHIFFEYGNFTPQNPCFLHKKTDFAQSNCKFDDIDIFRIGLLASGDLRG